MEKAVGVALADHWEVMSQCNGSIITTYNIMNSRQQLVSRIAAHPRITAVLRPRDGGGGDR